jgi:heat shock protein HtpX
MEMALRYFASDYYSLPFPIFGLLFLIFTFSVAGYNYMAYRQLGGRYVAEAFNSTEVNPETTNPKERQLLNMVEEMAIASSLPMPPVYIIDADQINAFAAGLHPNNAVIAVTKGALEQFNREEMQGVLAHEFGHIYNGDMKISMRLAAMIMGFFIIFYLGLKILNGARFIRISRHEGNKPILILALIFLVGGIASWFLGSILKAAVSREREYLADASAVQFTRSTEGIVSALRKIDAAADRDMPVSGYAYSHLYFDDHTVWGSLFATHPSIEMRIAAIQGHEYVFGEPKQNHLS